MLNPVTLRHLLASCFTIYCFRSRVLAWTLTRERQNYDFKTIQDSVGIESKSQTMLQEAFRNFERVTTHMGKEKELEEKIREQLSNATIRLMTEQYEMVRPHSSGR